jgi:hypothetical protein
MKEVMDGVEVILEEIEWLYALVTKKTVGSQMISARWV